MKRPVHCAEQLVGCKAQRSYDIHVDSPNTWNAVYIGRSNRSYLPTSPNVAPAKNNDIPRYQRNFWKTAETSFTLRGATGVTRQESPANITKYWSSSHLNFQHHGGATGVTFQHQIFRLSRNMTKYQRNFPNNGWNVYNVGSIRAWSRQSATRRATEVTFRAHHTHFVLKNTWFPRLPQHGDSWTSPNIDSKLNVQLAFGWTSLNIARATKTDCATCMQPNQILRLPRTVFSFTLLFLSSTILCFCSSFILRFFGYDSLTLYSTIFCPTFLWIIFFDATILWLYYAFILSLTLQYRSYNYRKFLNQTSFDCAKRYGYNYWQRTANPSF